MVIGSVENRMETELAVLPVGRIEDVLVTRLVAREQAALLGFSALALIQIATAVSEIARNVVQHSGGAGQFRLFRIEGAGRVGLRLTVKDSGCGIASLQNATAGTSSGAGIPGTRTLMDEFGIVSSPGAGTTVDMVKWLR